MAAAVIATEKMLNAVVARVDPTRSKASRRRRSRSTKSGR
jgi:hypothetical protein